MSEYFILQRVINVNICTCSYKSAIKNRLHDNFLQSWYADVSYLSKCFVYRMFKTTFYFEKYLDILPKNLARQLLKF